MIPASYLFKDIYRREWLHPARRRTALHHTSNALWRFLRRLSVPQARPSEEWSCTPAR